MKKGLNFLILESNRLDSDLILEELDRSGLIYYSQVVDSRDHYEELLGSHKPDIILSDYSIKAYDAVSAFHSMEKLAPGIPFIIVSNSIGEENSIALIKQGITDYVSKDKLFSLVPKIERALKDVESKVEKERSNKRIKLQNETLFEIAFLQSHEVRRPVANILGLINLINFDDPNDPYNSEVITKFKVTATELDMVMNRILKKTGEIKNIQ